MGNPARELTIIVPTCPRPPGGQYLLSTIQRLARVIPEDERERVDVVVVNVARDGSMGDELLELRRNPPMPLRFMDRRRPLATRAEATRDCPAYRLVNTGEDRVYWAYQQTRDFLEQMEWAATIDTRYILRLEDDGRVAEDLLPGIRRVVQRHPREPFYSLFSSRARFDGMTGSYHAGGVALLFPNDARLPPILKFVAGAAHLEGFDVVLGWYADASGRGGRTVFPSLVQHMGAVSSLGFEDSLNATLTQSPSYRDRPSQPADLLRQFRIARTWLRRRIPYRRGAA